MRSIRVYVPSLNEEFSIEADSFWIDPEDRSLHLVREDSNGEEETCATFTAGTYAYAILDETQDDTEDDYESPEQVQARRDRFNGLVSPSTRTAIIRDTQTLNTPVLNGHAAAGDAEDETAAAGEIEWTDY